MWHMKAHTKETKMRMNLIQSRFTSFNPRTTSTNCLKSRVVTIVAIAELSTRALVANKKEAMTEFGRVWTAWMFFLSCHVSEVFAAQDQTLGVCALKLQWQVPCAWEKRKNSSLQQELLWNYLRITDSECLPTEESVKGPRWLLKKAINSNW
jgi:hypothetical protein